MPKFRSACLALTVAGRLLLATNAPGAPSQPSSQTTTSVAAGYAATPPLRAILVAGGPDIEDNQVSIENSAIFVQHCLPKGASARILFASGNPKTQNVQRLSANGRVQYVPAQIHPVNGPSSVAALWHELALDARAYSQAVQRIAVPANSTIASTDPDQPAEPSGPLLMLYFGGHGSPGADNTYANTQYGMWNYRALTVRRLAAGIKALPARQPVVLVMAQCFSGGFGNVIFDDGDPGGQPVARSLAGFFASMPQRESSGCTPEVDQPDDWAFTGYFFAALSGRDRTGRLVAGADYNHDGVVGMDEALAYARVHDDSFDTPMCTSDTFLRRFVPMPTPLIVSTPYRQLAAWATPAQKGALDGLSQELRLTGQDRLARAYQRYRKIDADSGDMTDVRTIRFVFAAKSVVLQHQLEKYGTPALRARYAALQSAEAANPLRPATTAQPPAS